MAGIMDRLRPLKNELRTVARLLGRYPPRESLHQLGMKIDAHSLLSYRFAEPEILGVEPTTLCNIKCIMCGSPYWDNAERGHLSYDNSITIISQFHHLKLLHFCGIGEPLLNPEMIKMLRFAKSRAASVGLNTNATLLNAEVSQELCESGLGLLAVSIDGATARTYEKIRRGAHFEAVLDNLRTFREIKRKLGKNKPDLVIRTVLMKSNLEELPKIVSLSSDLGATFFHVERMMVGDPVKSYFNIPESLKEENTHRPELTEKTAEVFEECHAVAKEKNINFRLPPVKVDPLYISPFRCLAWTSPYVTRQGFLMPCCNLVEPREKQVNMGNLLKTPFSKIWNSPKYRAHRESIVSGNLYSKCKECSALLGMV